MLAGVISGYSDSDLVHASIGDGELVLDSGLLREQLYRFDEYFMNAPALRYVIHVPGFFDLASLPLRDTRRPWLPIVLNCMTGGWFQADTCIAVILRILADIGVRLSAPVLTPRDLLESLHARGFETIEIEPPV